MYGIYKKLKEAGLCDNGIFGLMGNLKAESNLNSTNMQNSFEKHLGFTDKTYTQAVDNGEYKNFVMDGVGYGLAQWTYWTRKQALLSYSYKKGCSIGNENMQVDFLIHELRTSYPSVWKVLKTAKSIKIASDIVLTKFERPANQSEQMKKVRARYGLELQARCKIDEPKALKSVDTIAKEVIQGLWGAGNERKEKLIQEGYDFSIVQKRVNAIMK